MQNFILIFLIISTTTNGFIFPNFFQNSISKFNGKINLPEELDSLPIKNEFIQKVSEFNHNLIDNGIHHFKSEISPEIIKFSSGLLPAMDSIAHHVLKANQNFIGLVLSLDQLPEHIKKDLVLFSISSAQHGDKMGGQILEFYYHLADKLL